MSIDRANFVGNIGTLLIIVDILAHPYISVQRGSIFPYYIAKGCRFEWEILLTPQMTGTKNEDGTTRRVQPYRTAAVVGYIMYMRVASSRYAEASRFRLHEGTILNQTTIKIIQRNFA